MKEFTLTGVISVENTYPYNFVLVEQEDGYKIDLISRVKEMCMNYPLRKISFSYYISDNPVSENEMLESFLKKISGSVEAEFTSEEYSYSSWTKGVDYNTTFSIGGHDLYSELCSKAGKYIIIKIKFI